MSNRDRLRSLVETAPEGRIEALLAFYAYLEQEAEQLDEETAADIQRSLADPRPDIPHDELWARLDSECGS